VAPKFEPLIVTEAPTWPEVGDKLLMLGAGTVTVNGTPLLARPFAVTTTLPVTAPFGTGATILVSLQFVGVAAVPFTVTVPDPCVAPKFAPAMVTNVPTGPVVGERLLMDGAGGITEKFKPLLACPPTVTTIFPVVALFGTGTTTVVALQLLGVAALPLKLTMLVP